MTTDTIDPSSAPPVGIVHPEGFPGLPSGWISEYETFPASDRSLQLFSVLHHPEDWGSHPHGSRVLFVVHGLGEHSGRYFHLPHYLKDVFGAVYCLDQRGHGRSEGLRGHCDRFGQFTDDLAEAIVRLSEKIKQRFGRAEIHVLGHSFGGLVALRTHFLNATLPVKSLIVSAPLLGVKVQVPWIKKLAGRGLSKIWGSLQMANEVNPADLSHDPAVSVAYRNDRLVHDRVTPRFYTEMLDAISDTVSRDAGLPYPLLMIIPLGDKIVDPEASQKFFKQLKVRGKQLRTYPAFFHESLNERVNETGKEKVFEDISAWINESKTPSQG
jgi:alpha-beta hydrolase superfamily lysophospholipase